MVARPKPTTLREAGKGNLIAAAASRALGWLVVLGILAAGLAVLPDMQDRFRLVKESVLRVEAIVGVLLVTVAVAFGGTQRLREMSADRPALLVAAAAVVWTAVTILTSTNRPVSAASFVTVFCAALLFLTVWYAGPNVPIFVFDALVIIVSINTVLAALQETEIWQPFVSSPEAFGHLETTGLIDNPNVLGSYLAIAAIALATAAWKIEGSRRMLYAAGALIATGGVAVSQTRTAVITLLAVAVIAAAIRSIRWAALAAAGTAAALILGSLLGIDAARRVLILPFYAARDLHGATSGRVIPFLIAGRMVRDAPLTGMGPGTYGYNYMAYQSELVAELSGRHRWMLGTNFAETHNDHLQVMAETGVPGYLILMGALLVVARQPRGQPGGDARFEIGRALGFPLAAAFIILALAQFPLQVAVMRHLFLTMAALVIAWRDR